MNYAGTTFVKEKLKRSVITKIKTLTLRDKIKGPELFYFS